MMPIRAHTSQHAAWSRDPALWQGEEGRAEPAAGREGLSCVCCTGQPWPPGWTRFICSPFWGEQPLSVSQRWRLVPPKRFSHQSLAVALLPKICRIELPIDTHAAESEGRGPPLGLSARRLVFLHVAVLSALLHRALPPPTAAAFSPLPSVSPLCASRGLGAGEAWAFMHGPSSAALGLKRCTLHSHPRDACEDPGLKGWVCRGVSGR